MLIPTPPYLTLPGSAPGSAELRASLETFSKAAHRELPAAWVGPGQPGTVQLHN